MGVSHLESGDITNDAQVMISIARMTIVQHKELRIESPMGL